MLPLIAGVALFVLLHVLPMTRGRVRTALVDTLGQGLYRAGFALLTLTAVGLMIWGWRSAPVVPLAALPPAFATIGTVLAFVGVIVMLSSVYPSRIRRWLRHPQFVGVILWSVGHLLHGISVHKLVLFGGLGLWALVWLCKEDWTQRKPGNFAPLHFDVLGFAVSLLVAVGISWIHALVYANLI